MKGGGNKWAGIYWIWLEQEIKTEKRPLTLFTPGHRWREGDRMDDGEQVEGG